MCKLCLRSRRTTGQLDQDRAVSGSELNGSKGEVGVRLYQFPPVDAVFNTHLNVKDEQEYVVSDGYRI